MSYGSIIRKEIFYNSEKRMIGGKLYDDVEVLKICFEENERDRRYIILVVQDFLSSRINRYEAKKYLLKNVICPFLHCRKVEAERLKAINDIMEDDKQ